MEIIGPRALRDRVGKWFLWPDQHEHACEGRVVRVLTEHSRRHDGVPQFHGYRRSLKQGSQRRLIPGPAPGDGIEAIVYSGILNEDVDGAPQCGVFPADAGIDRLVNATNLVGGGMFNELPDGVAHPWMWRGVVNMT